MTSTTYSKVGEIQIPNAKPKHFQFLKNLTALGKERFSIRRHHSTHSCLTLTRAHAAAAAAPTRGSCSKTDEIPGPSFRACLNKASQSRHGGGGAVASPRGDVVGGVCGREATAACCYCSTTVLLLVALVSLGNFLSVFSPLHTSTTTLWPVLKIFVPKLKLEI